MDVQVLQTDMTEEMQDSVCDFIIEGFKKKIEYEAIEFTQKGYVLAYLQGFEYALYDNKGRVVNEGPLSFGQVATTEYNEETKEVIVTANGIEVYRGKNLNPLPSVDPNAEPTVAQ